MSANFPFFLSFLLPHLRNGRNSCKRRRFNFYPFVSSLLNKGLYLLFFFLSLSNFQVWRVSIKDGQCGEAEAIDVGSQPKDLTLAAVSPELALVSIDTGVVLLRGSNIVSTINLGFTVTASVLAPDGSEVIVGGQDGKLHIYSVADDSLTEEATIEKHRGAISVIRYSPDLTMFASGDLNREAIVWDRATREVVFQLPKVLCLLLD